MGGKGVGVKVKKFSETTSQKFAFTRVYNIVAWIKTRLLKFRGVGGGPPPEREQHDPLPRYTVYPCICAFTRAQVSTGTNYKNATPVWPNLNRGCDGYEIPNTWPGKKKSGQGVRGVRGWVRVGKG